MVVIAVSAWQHPARHATARACSARSMRLALPCVAVAAVLQVFVGHFEAC